MKITFVRSRLHAVGLVAFLCAALLCCAAATGRAQNIGAGKQRKPLTPDLKPGDYVWHPEVSPTGPVAIIASLSVQTLYVYRNGVLIGRSTVSSGKDGHNTPTGVFTILEKNVVHHSSKYHGAPMPYMERLTWGGVAIHAGGLPGYPESHGCIHVPMDFAKKLYEVTDKGTTVFVTDAKAVPSGSAQPGLLFSADPGGESPPAAASPAGDGFTWKPEAAPTGPVSVIFSSADKQVYVYRNGTEIGRSAIGGEAAGQSYGNHVYAALDQATPDGEPRWNVLNSLEGAAAPDISELSKRLNLPPEFRAHVREIIAPGTTLVVTDQSVNATTRSGPGFSVLDAGGR